MAVIKGGGKLEARLREIAANVSKGATLQVGYLENATYPDGTSVALVAAVNEYGRPSIGQPPRPSFRNMIAAKSGEWPDAVGALLVAHDYDATKALDETGEAIEVQLRQSILDLTSPPLKQSTIDAKGFDKPLIHHNDMINAVAHTVKS